MEFVILKISIGSFLPILPIVLLVILLIILRKKKKAEREKVLGGGLGRKGKKDHLWLIIKDYLKKKSLFGYSIETAYIFDRPPKEDLHIFLKKALIFRTKKEAKENGVRYRRPNIPKRFPEEDYFDSLEEETLEMNREYLVPKNSKVKPQRKRYVILFRTKTDSEGVSDWNAIEAEILKKSSKEGTVKDVVVINRELEVDREMGWILPLLHDREKEKDRKLKEEGKSRKK